MQYLYQEMDDRRLELISLGRAERAQLGVGELLRTFKKKHYENSSRVRTRAKRARGSSIVQVGLDAFRLAVRIEAARHQHAIQAGGAEGVAQVLQLGLEVG